MFHVELRQFPGNVCRFNLTEQELYATVLARWAQGDWVELGERKWSPHQAKLTVLEGPQVPPERLTMGRGWRYAQREGKDVTERVVLEAQKQAEDRRAEDQRAAGGRGQGQRLENETASEEALLVDSLGLALLGSIGEQCEPLQAAWKLALERFPERSAGACLTLVERSLRTLLDSRLITLTSDREGHEQLGESEVELALRTLESWSTEHGPACVWMLRS